MYRFILFLLVGLLPGLAAAQPAAERQAAADQLLAQKAIRIRFTADGVSWLFETDVRRLKTDFPGSPDPVCFATGVPTRLDFVDPHLVFEFRSLVRGCQAMQYRFDPVSGAGRIFVSDDGRATWTESGNARIALVR